MRADFSLDYDVLTVERPQKLYLMARFVAGPALDDVARRPLNLSLVIDRSGSMAGDKIDNIRQAAQFLVQNLNVRDLFSIVLYNDKVETLVAPEKVSHKDALTQQLDRIRVSGTTNLSGGWLEGCKHVAANLQDETLNRVILMSDGLANRGVTDSDKLVSLARQKYGEGVSTTTMGLGSDFNEDLMMAISNAGGGAFYFIESPEVAPLIFKEELQGLLNVVGQNLMITIDPTDHVKTINQLNAYPMSSEEKKVSFRLGDIFGDEVKTLVLELSTPALKDIGEYQIAHLRFEYDELHADGGTEHRIWDMPVMVNIQPDDEQPRLANPDVIQSVLLLRAAQARNQAVQAADKGQYGAASNILKEIAEAIVASGVDHSELKEEYAALLEQAKKMERGPETYDDYSRKTMATQAFYTMVNRHDDTMMLRDRELKRTSLQEKATATDATEQHIEKRPGVPPTHVSWEKQVYELKSDLVRIGRAIHNEIIIREQGVSRFHCQVRRDGDQLLLEDVGSTNGTLVNGVRLDGSHTLSIGDEVHLCDEKLIFHDNVSDEK